MLVTTAVWEGGRLTIHECTQSSAGTRGATARALLGACLAGSGDDYLVPHLTAANQWAIDVGLAAGLTLAQSGFLGVRGMAPPAPYIHNGALL